MIAATLGYVMYVIIAGNIDADIDIDVKDTKSLMVHICLWLQMKM